MTAATNPFRHLNPSLKVIRCAGMMSVKCRPSLRNVEAQLHERRRGIRIQPETG